VFACFAVAIALFAGITGYSFGRFHAEFREARKRAEKPAVHDSPITREN